MSTKYCFDYKTYIILHTSVAMATDKEDISAGNHPSWQKSSQMHLICRPASTFPVQVRNNYWTTFLSSASMANTSLHKITSSNKSKEFVLLLCQPSTGWESLCAPSFQAHWLCKRWMWWDHVRWIMLVEFNFILRVPNSTPTPVLYLALIKSLRGPEGGLVVKGLSIGIGSR